MTPPSAPPPPEFPTLSHTRHLVEPGSKFKLASHDPAATGPFETEEEAGAELAKLRARVADLQDRFQQEDKRALLIVLQGFDGSGKDEVIGKFLNACNPAGVRVHNFKKPSGEEAAHDFLWRFHQQTPALGMIQVFDRSHYEGVIYPRVYDLVDDATFHERLESINDFERLLVREGTVVVKLFLHISKDEQAERVRERLTNPKKQGEFGVPDVKEREAWDGYDAAYEAMISATSTPWAPWHAIPADRKWYVAPAAGEIIVDVLDALGPQYPGLDEEALEEAGISGPDDVK
jgi:PPK2 family polyphosphate:nucleotide phosphotransferase